MIARMARLEIVFMRRRLAEMVAFLQEKGLVHLEEVPLAAENAPGFLHRVHLDDAQKAELARLEELHRLLKEVLPLLARRVSDAEVENATRHLSQADLATWAQLARTWSVDLRYVSNDVGKKEASAAVAGARRLMQWANTL